MWIPPKVCDSFFDLYGGGRVYFGRAQRGGGQSAGTPPIMARIDCEPYYPSGWFVVTRKKAMLAINRLMQDNSVDGQTFLPDWLVSDCYRGEVERLRSIMAAAADEIEAHWEAHCDGDGYGPVNLVRRLRTGKGDYRTTPERRLVVDYLRRVANKDHPIEAGRPMLSPAGRGLLLLMADNIARGEHEPSEPR